VTKNKYNTKQQQNSSHSTTHSHYSTRPTSNFSLGVSHYLKVQGTQNDDPMQSMKADMENRGIATHS